MVIWALGWSMIFLAGLIHLPIRFNLAIGLLLIIAHNLLDQFHIPGNSLQSLVWSILHEQLFFQWQNKTFVLGYPILPWVGVMALGYCFGALFTSTFKELERKKLLIWIGSVAVFLFIFLRLLNGYGDPLPWETQSSDVFTFLSFFNTTKYLSLIHI